MSACKREIITGYDPRAASVIGCQVECPLGLELSLLAPSLHRQEGRADWGPSHGHKGDVIVCIAAFPSLSVAWLTLQEVKDVFKGKDEKQGKPRGRGTQLSGEASAHRVQGSGFRPLDIIRKGKMGPSTPRGSTSFPFSSGE